MFYTSGKMSVPEQPRLFDHIYESGTKLSDIYDEMHMVEIRRANQQKDLEFRSRLAGIPLADSTEIQFIDLEQQPFFD